MFRRLGLWRVFSLSLFFIAPSFGQESRWELRDRSNEARALTEVYSTVYKALNANPEAVMKAKLTLEQRSRGKRHLLWAVAVCKDLIHSCAPHETFSTLVYETGERRDTTWEYRATVYVEPAR